MNNILFDLSKEIIVITGVSGQLGTSYANAFLAQGAKVVGLDINKTYSKSKFEINFSENFLFCEVDVTSKRSLEQALVEITYRFGTPTVLINNAAIDSPPSSSALENGFFEEYPESSWDKIIDVNVKGVFLCCQIFGSAMAKNFNGSIINISSIYGLLSPDQSLYEYRREKGDIFFKPVSYSVSKSAILNLTRYLAVYWAKHSVRVNTLTISGVFNNQDQGFLNAYCGRIPIGRMAEPIDYIGPILFLASSGSSYMTGSNLIIDGGWTAI